MESIFPPSFQIFLFLKKKQKGFSLKPGLLGICISPKKQKPFFQKKKGFHTIVLF